MILQTYGIYLSLIGNNDTGRQRNDQGRYVETISEDTVLDAVRESPDPIMTAVEIANRLDCSSEAARRKLTQLHDKGYVHRRKVSANAVVWWLTDDTTE